MDGASGLRCHTGTQQSQQSASSPNRTVLVDSPPTLPNGEK